MDYFNDVAHLSGPWKGLWWRALSDFIKNILIGVLKMNGGLTSLERYEGE